MSLNIATFNIMFYNLLKLNNQIICNSRNINIGKINLIKETLNKHNIDILCVQEDILLNPEYFDRTGNNVSPLEIYLDNYIRVTSCIAEQINNELFLHNSIYLKKNNISILDSKNYNVQPSIKGNYLSIPRCVSIVEININKKPIKIANIHLSGGKFEDQKYYLNLNNKDIQMSSIIDNYHPDIVTGDFNGSIDMDFFPYNYDFFKSLKTNEEKINFIRFFQGGHLPLIFNNYISDSSKNFTTPYNNKVDYIYYKKPNITILNEVTIDFITNHVSDHNMVCVNLKI